MHPHFPRNSVLSYAEPPAYVTFYKTFVRYKPRAAPYPAHAPLFISGNHDIEGQRKRTIKTDAYFFPSVCDILDPPQSAIVPQYLDIPLFDIYRQNE